MNAHRDLKLFQLFGLTPQNRTQRAVLFNLNGIKRETSSSPVLVSILCSNVFNVFLEKLNAIETSPTTLFVYSFPEPSERFNPRLRSVLVHAKPVIHARWNPVRHGALVLCCNSGGFYIWSNEWASNSTDEEVAECVGIPTSQFLFLLGFLMIYSSTVNRGPTNAYTGCSMGTRWQRHSSHRQTCVLLRI